MDFLKITKSKTREKILRLFFSDTEKKYYLRQLERILDLPVGNIRRELLALEKIGLFKKEKAGNQTHYSINKQSAVYNDFKNIVFKTIGVEGSLKKEIKDIKGINFAFIFGSYAKNKEDSFSDVDLFIIGNPDEDILIGKISEIEKEINREINYNIFSEKDLANSIIGKNVFILNILESAKIFIKGDKDELEKITGRREPSGKEN